MPDKAGLMSLANAFDILPALHELLARLDHGISHDGETGHYAELQPLEPKDVPTQALPIKARIRRALRELEKLPDMGRSVEEQREEIEELEERIQKQRAVLGGLAEAARRPAGRMGGRA